MKRMKNSDVPLIIENHPDEYDGYPFITLIQQVRTTFLTIVDNMEKNTIRAFILDYCAPEAINEKHIVDVAADWYENSKDKYPVSIEFSKSGLTHETSKIYREFNAEFITRIIGPVPRFPMAGPVRIRRRKRRIIPKGVIVQNRLTFQERIGCSVRGDVSG